MRKTNRLRSVVLIDLARASAGQAILHVTLQLIPKSDRNVTESKSRASEILPRKKVSMPFF